MLYLQVILPLPLPGYFTYFVRGQYRELKGCRVTVPFGKRKIYTGIVYKVSENPPISQYNIKEVLDILDDRPILNSRQIEFLKWISKYYMCSIGDAYNAAVPSNLKLSSDSFIGLIPDQEIDYSELDDHEYNVIQFLSKGELSTEEIRQITGLKSPYRIIKNLKEKGLIYLFERVKDKFVAKKESRIRLNDDYMETTSLEKLAQDLEKWPKQLDAILMYLKKVDLLTDPRLNDKGYLRRAFIDEGISPSSVNTLVKKEIFIEWKQVIDRFSFDDLELRSLSKLSSIQQIARNSISDCFQNSSVTLLKGITGSGKTEIYMDLIADKIQNGNQALLLLPEIALTTQIIKRFRQYFGDRFGVYHSRFSDNERAEIYQHCLAGKYDFVIGVRSSIFLPFQNLSLIIVDEEHEHSFKQYEPAPRYHARDGAIYLGRLHKANVLLASATPSLESYKNAQDKKYGYVTLDERFEKQPLPQIEYVDLIRERKKNRIKGSTSSILLEEVQNSLTHDKQVILFQNRRGYAPFLQCDNCNHIPKCPNCSVSLTYHIYQNQLICHYCGFNNFYDPNCSSCGSEKVRTVGIGTEKIEEELNLLLPEVQIKRMDLDTTRNKYSYQQIIDDFESGSIQILIGTQMVAKGLDFERVNLVGIYEVDRLIHFPDFRSYERAFQMITQVSGRSGRKHERGKVLIQTNDPLQEILQHIKEGHLDLFYAGELEERSKFRYPPYYRLIQVVFRHREKQVSLEAANHYHFLIQKELGSHRALHPTTPVISKIRNYYIHEIIIKLEKERINLDAVKEFLQSCRDTLLALPAFKSVLVHFDVDPI